MFSAPFNFKCSACGRDLDLTVAEPPFCMLCDGLFCPAHLIVKNGVATCESCAEERDRREVASGISEEDQARVVALLRADIEATIGAGHDARIIEDAARLRLFAGDAAQYLEEVVHNVQQHLHDTFVDTTWPACPFHPNHPLWFSFGYWRCERTGTPVARLGMLSTLSGDKAHS